MNVPVSKGEGKLGQSKERLDPSRSKTRKGKDQTLQLLLSSGLMMQVCVPTALRGPTLPASLLAVDPNSLLSCLSTPAFFSGSSMVLASSLQLGFLPLRFHAMVSWGLFAGTPILTPFICFPAALWKHGKRLHDHPLNLKSSV